ncbi:geranylgeranyl transferase type-1 subunit beta [Planococcus citri]|uniref:geranylgeranyl transferase type-1 subunit beta n=1 Tax=Planococcus citri TaxID=170843 RepID=UPI0031F8F7B8
MSGDSRQLKINLHIKFLQRFLHNAPKSLATYEPIRPTIIFFIVSSLDLLNDIDSISAAEKSAICDWIYQMQAEPRSEAHEESHAMNYGFFGSRTLVFQDSDNHDLSEYNFGQLGMTYSCLCTLIILGDDLSRVNKSAILKSIKHLQSENGSFLANVGSSESDMRFVYCAIVICYILNDFSHINVPKCVDFISKSVHYDGGISLEPNLESHGGSSFCAIAALHLLDQLKTALNPNQLKRIQRWLILRQQSGFQGRPEKDVDTCYSFWVGAALKLIDSFDFVDREKNKQSIMGCQDRFRGGFSKFLYTEVDLLHTYFALCGLSLMEEPGLLEMNPALNMSVRAFRHLKQLHDTWNN